MVIGSTPAAGVTSSTASTSSTDMSFTIKSTGVSLYSMLALSYVCTCMYRCFFVVPAWQAKIFS